MAALQSPLDTREQTSRVVAARRLNRDDRVLAQAISLRIVRTLRMSARRAAYWTGANGAREPVSGGWQ